jgi:hypothetical protein
MASRDEMITDLRTMLRDMFAASASGAGGPRLARAHGYVDGYMRAMLDVGVATKSDLLAVVMAERERFAGPALREVDREEDAIAQAV